MKNSIILTALTILSATCHAQVNAYRVNNTLHNANTTLQNANSTLQQTGLAVNQAAQGVTTVITLGKMLTPKKKETQPTATAAPTAAPAAPVAEPATGTKTTFVIEKCNYGQFRALISNFEKTAGVALVEKQLIESTATITLTHSLTEFDLLDIAERQMPGKLSVKRVEKNYISVAVYPG